MPRQEIDPRDLNLGPDGFPSVMPDERLAPPDCEDCSHERVWSISRPTMAYCARCDAYETILPRCFCGEDANDTNYRGEAVCGGHRDREVDPHWEWRDSVMETPKGVWEF
jgi:hypothetical protein